MTIQYINTGSSANAGNGDSIRLAFTKVNENFAQHDAEINALNQGNVATLNVASTASTRDFISTGTATFNNVVITGLVSGDPEFQNILVLGTGTFGTVDAVMINSTGTATFNNVTIGGVISGAFSYANLTVTNTLTVLKDILVGNSIQIGNYTFIEQQNLSNDFAIVKDDPNGLNFVLRNVHADSYTNLNLQDNISGGLAIVHQDSTNNSGNYNAGQNYIFGQTPSDILNIGAYSDINFYASAANYNTPANTYLTPVMSISAQTGDVSIGPYTFPNTTGTTGQVLGWPVSGHTLVWENASDTKFVQGTNPPSANTSTFWYDTITGRTYIYYDGGWIDASPAGNNVSIVSPPAHSTSTGFIGQIAHDSSYMYVCVGTSTWVRSAIVGGW